MNILRSFTFAILLSFAFFVVTPVVKADSAIRLIMDGNTYYLSTTESKPSTSSSEYRVVTVNDTVTSAATATPSSRNSRNSVLPGDILLPTGYSQSIGQLISFILRVVIIVAILLCLLAFITAGIEWITSGGDKGKTDGARQRIIAALVGIVILSAAYALTLLVAYILGFDSFEDVFNSIKRIN